jgi:tape measure domain-containing protein
MADFKIDTSHAREEVDALIMTLKNLRKATGGTSQEMHRDLALIEAELRNLQEAGKVSEKSLQRINKALKDVGVTARLTIGAYQKLQDEFREARTHARNMAVQYGVMSSKARAAAKSADVLEKKLRRVNNTLKKQSSFAKGLNKVLGKMAFFASAFIGVQTVINFGKNIFEVTKRLDAFNFSMEAVLLNQQELLDGQVELAQTTEFLRRITNDYGADLIQTTNRYIKFRAAAGQANLTLQETQGIFETMTKVSGVLGLQTDELSGIYLALEQMISKGKVTTEELRRQLGERLPGAVDIMARSIGVSTEKLSEMMKKGEVITKDVLPKFAEEVEKAFGIENVHKVDTLAAAQYRLNNAWISLIDTIESGSGVVSNTIGFIFNDLTELLQQIERMNMTEQDFLDKQKAVGYENAIKSINEQMRIYRRDNADFVTEDTEKELVAVDLSEAITEFENLNKQISSQDKLVTNLSKAYDKVKGKTTNEAIGSWDMFIPGVVTATYDKVIEKQNEAAQGNLEFNEKALFEMQSRAEYLKGMIKAYKDLLKEGEDDPIAPKEEEKRKIDTSREDAEINRLKRQAEVQKMIADSEEAHVSSRIQASKEFNETLVELEEAKAIKSIKLADGNAVKIADIEAQKNHNIRMLRYRAVADLAAINSDASKIELKRLQDQYDQELNVAIAAIKAKYRALGELTEEQEKAMNAELKALREENNDALIEAQIAFLEEYMKNLKLSKKEELAIIQLIAKLRASLSVKSQEDDLDRDSNYLEEKLELLRDFTHAVSDIIDASFARKIEAINAEIDAETKKYDELHRLAEGDAKQQESLERQKQLTIEKLEAKRLKVEQKQARFRKAQALIDIAINTAIAVSKATAQTGIGFVVPVPIIIALGAAQAAAVLAQPIPQYKDGLERAKSDHIAMINDGKDQEFVKRGSSILTTSTKNAIVSLRKGDKVYKDKQDLLSDANLISILANGKNITNSDYDRLEYVIESGLEKGFRKAKVNNHINLKGFNMEHEAYRNKMSNWGKN